MIRTRRMRSFKTLLAGASAAAFFASGAASAQEAEAEVEELDVGEIVVTGSRIRSPNATAVSPLQVVGTELIESQGAINIQEALQINPAFGLPGASRMTSNTDITTAGSSTVNLRNLGPNRTLVLVDGRRMIAGRPGTTQVDLTMIPTEIIIAAVNML